MHPMELPRTDVVLSEEQPTPTAARERAVGLGLDRAFHPRRVNGETVYLPGSDPQTLRNAINAQGREIIDRIPVLPDELQELSQAWLNRWAYWVAAGRPDVTPVRERDLGDAPRNQDELNERVKERKAERESEKTNFTRTYNPALHPRDPETGKFVERVFDVPDGTPKFEEMSSGKTLKYLSDNGANVEPVLDRNTAMTVDGIPNNAESMEDVARASNDMSVDDLDEPIDGPTVGDDGGDMISEPRDGDEILDEDLDLDPVDEAGSDLDDSLGDDTVELGGEPVDKPSVGRIVEPSEVEVGEDVTLLQSNGVPVSGTVSRFNDSSRKPLVRVDFDNSDNFTSVFEDDHRKAMFKADPDQFPDRMDIIPDELNPNSDGEQMVSIRKPNGETYHGTLGGTMSTEPRLNVETSDGDEPEVEYIDASEILDSRTEITTHPDAEKYTDIPGVDPLPEDEGGLTEIPDDATPEELIDEIRTINDVDINDEYNVDGSVPTGADLPDDVEEDIRETLKPIAARVKDDQIMREYAKRTFFADDLDRAENRGGQTDLREEINVLTMGDPHEASTRRHEMGHGLLHMIRKADTDTTHSQASNYWPDEINPRTTSIIPYMIGEYYRGERKPFDWERSAFGFSDWREESLSRLDSIDSPDSEFEIAGAAIGQDLEPGDVMRFPDSDGPNPDDGWKEYEVLRLDENLEGETRNVLVRDPAGSTRRVSIAQTDTDTHNEGQLEIGSQPHRIAKGYSDAPDDGFEPDVERDGRMPDIYEDTRFTETNTPDVDDVREQFQDAEDWEEKLENLTSAVNRAYFEMWLRYELRGEQVPILTGYSSTNAHEVMSQLHELMQTTSEISGRGGASRIADNYPELVAAYLEVFEPSPEAKQGLKDAGGVTLDNE